MNDFTNIHIIFHVKPVRRGLANGSGYNNRAIPENIVPYLRHKGSMEIPGGGGGGSQAKTTVFKKKVMELNWIFWRGGGGVKTRKPSWIGGGGGEGGNRYYLEPHTGARACHGLSQFNSVEQVVRLSRIHPSLSHTITF